MLSKVMCRITSERGTTVVGHGVFYNGNQSTEYLYPLYLYPDDLFNRTGRQSEKKPNLAPALLKALNEAHQRRPSPDEILYYIYAVSYAPSYRTTYAEFLKTDFSRIPFTKNQELFLKLAKLGKELWSYQIGGYQVLDKWLKDRRKRITFIFSGPLN